MAVRSRPGGAAKRNPFTDPKPSSQPETAEAGVADEDEQDYEDIIRLAVATTEAESLYVPPKIERDQPEVPDDWTSLTDTQLQRLYGDFAAFAQRAAYLEKIETAKGKLCKAAADELFDSLFGELTIGKDTSVTHLKSQVESDPHIKRWRKRQHKHEAFALGHKMDRERFRDMVEALSRIHSMRKDEWEMAGQKTGGSGKKK